MHDLTPMTALGGREPRVDVVAGVTCSEVPDVALVSVAARLGKERQTRTAIKKLMKADLPAPMQFTGCDLTAFWTGPDQYMIEAPISSHEDIADRVKIAVSANASVTEQTDAWTRFDLTSAGVLDVLELLCPLNTRMMRTGDAQRTTIHHLGCFVLCRAVDRFSLYGPRASAGSFHHAVCAAMKAAL